MSTCAVEVCCMQEGCGHMGKGSEWWDEEVASEREKNSI